MAEEQKNPVAKIEGGKVVPSAAADAVQAQAIADAEAAAGMAVGGDVASMQQARDAAAAAGATNAVANLDAAIAAAPQQTGTSNIPPVVAAAAEKGIITTAQAEQIGQMAAEQTVASSVTAPDQVQQSFASNVQTPETTYTGQVAADKAAKPATRSVA
ncbi:MAG: hypothetical protein LW823_02335 [Rickettsiales bacterium]|nr:hypothetical protein [Rickettsiales bacterium]